MNAETKPGDGGVQVGTSFTKAWSALVAALVVGLSIRTFFLFPALVPSESMEPTVKQGERILVDRFTYAFRRPTRGEVVVFDSPGSGNPLPPGLIYIKRLAGFAGEEAGINADGQLVLNGNKWIPMVGAQERDPRAGNGTARELPRPGVFHGYANAEHLKAAGMDEALSSRFPDPDARVKVKSGCVLVLGDNTLVSYDSRAWGDLPVERISGRALLVVGVPFWGWRWLR